MSLYSDSSVIAFLSRLEEHLEEKEESDVSKIILYDNYLAACIDKNFQAVEQNDFNRVREWGCLYQNGIFVE